MAVLACATGNPRGTGGVGAMGSNVVVLFVCGGWGVDERMGDEPSLERNEALGGQEGMGRWMACFFVGGCSNNQIDRGWVCC